MNIVITGNTSGIGEMLSKRLEKQGHIIFGLSRSAKHFKCDVTNYEELEGWANYMLDCNVYLDAIITCAGTQGEIGKLQKTDPSAWLDTIRVNLGGTYNTIRAFYPLMDKTSRRPKIICLAGGGAANGRAFFSAYATAKAGVVRLVESFSLEEVDVDINVIAPGAIKTNIISSALKVGPEVVGQEEYNKAKKQNELGDDPTPLLELVDWLLSDKSDNISGRFISAKWDDWKNFSPSIAEEAYRLRRTIGT